MYKIHAKLKRIIILAYFGGTLQLVEQQTVGLSFGGTWQLVEQQTVGLSFGGTLQLVGNKQWVCHSVGLCN